MRTADFSKAPAQARGTALFLGATNYQGLLALMRVTPRWLRMARDMRRTSGYRWHRLYWQFPFTIGTVAVFADRDTMLRFARSRRHRDLMVWLTDGRRNAAAGFIRLYTADSAGYSNGAWRAEANEMAHIAEFTSLSTEEHGPAVVR